MSDLTFYTNPMSRGRIVRWMLEELGEPYETIVLGFGPDMNAPDYLALNPMGKVPTVVHSHVVVTEAAAICAYLADAFPEAGLAPPSGSPERGAYYRWLFFGAGPVEGASSDSSFGWKAASPTEEGRLGYGSLARVETTLATMLETGPGPWLLGEQFTAADVYLGAQIGWMLGFGIFEKRPAFTTYSERLRARPAAQRAKELDDALMPQDAGG